MVIPPGLLKELLPVGIDIPFPATKVLFPAKVLFPLKLIAPVVVTWKSPKNVLFATVNTAKENALLATFITWVKLLITKVPTNPEVTNPPVLSVDVPPPTPKFICPPVLVLFMVKLE